MKLTFEDKKQIYAEWKEDRKGMNSIAQFRHLNATSLRYMIRSIQRFVEDLQIFSADAFYYLCLFRTMIRFPSASLE